jgi:hypothetical protein
MGLDPLEESQAVGLEAPKADLPSLASRQLEVSSSTPEIVDEFTRGKASGRAQGSPG